MNRNLVRKDPRTVVDEDLVAAGKCGRQRANAAKLPRDKRYCTEAAGWKTDHAGEGACYKHGGCCTGPKSGHGLRSKRLPKTLSEKRDALLADRKQLADLAPPIALLVTQLQAWVERVETDGDELPLDTIETLSGITEKLTRMQERLVKLAAHERSAVTPEELARFMRGIEYAVGQVVPKKEVERFRAIVISLDQAIALPVDSEVVED